MRSKQKQYSSRKRQYGAITIKNVNSEGYTPVAFGITTRDNNEFAVVTRIKARVDGRMWSDVNYDCLIYVFEDGELISSPISSFVIQDVIDEAHDYHAVGIAKEITTSTCIAIAQGKLNVYFVRDSVIKISKLSKMVIGDKELVRIA